MRELNNAEGTVNPHQLLFGINQGGTYADIRVNHARTIRDMDLDGYAIGGLAVGETHEEMYRILDEVVPELPQNKPTYLMGVGTPANILEGVDRGIDFFDCVYPSRNGRHGHVYTNHGKLNLLMRSSNWMTDRLKRDVSVRLVAITQELISAICLRQRKCWVCVCVYCIICIFIII